MQNKLGLRRDDRIQYGHRGYCTYLRKQDQAVVESAEKQDSLFVLVERWLERTPFLHLVCGPDARHQFLRRMPSSGLTRGWTAGRV